MKVELLFITNVNADLLKTICVKHNVSCFCLKEQGLFCFFCVQNELNLKSILLENEFEIKLYQRTGQNLRQLKIIGKVKVFFNVQKTTNDIFTLINMSDSQMQQLRKVMSYNGTSKKIKQVFDSTQSLNQEDNESLDRINNLIKALTLENHKLLEYNSSLRDELEQFKHLAFEYLRLYQSLKK